MNNKEKVKLLYNKHIKITIEWSGIPDMMLNTSTMSEEGAAKLLDILQSSKDKKEIEKVVLEIINNEKYE